MRVPRLTVSPALPAGLRGRLREWASLHREHCLPPAVLGAGVLRAGEAGRRMWTAGSTGRGASALPAPYLSYRVWLHANKTSFKKAAGDGGFALGPVC